MPPIFKDDVIERAFTMAEMYASDVFIFNSLVHQRPYKNASKRPWVGRLTAEQVRTAARRLLDDTGCHAAAGRLRSIIGQSDTGQIFAARIAEPDGSGSTAQI